MLYDVHHRNRSMMNLKKKQSFLLMPLSFEPLTICNQKLEYVSYIYYITFKKYEKTSIYNPWKLTLKYARKSIHFCSKRSWFMSTYPFSNWSERSQVQHDWKLNKCCTTVIVPCFTVKTRRIFWKIVPCKYC